MDEIKEQVLERYNTGFNKHNNMKLVELELNHSKVEAPLNENSMNPNGIAHGGFIYSLADNAMGVAAVTNGRNVCTVNCQIDYLRPGTGTKLTAEAESVKVGKTLAVFRCNIYNDADKLIASASGTYYFID